MKNKLLNFTICQVLVVIVMSLSHVKCDDNKASTSLPAADARNVTQYDRSFHKLLSRRKRFLLWRPGSNVLLTAALIKTLAFVRPGGHALIMEWDIFYPLPATWYVDKKKKPAPPPPPPPKPEPPAEEEVIDHSDAHKHPGEIWVPPAGWSSDTDVIKSISDEKRRIWNQSNTRRRLLQPVTQYQNPLISNSVRAWQQSPLSQVRSTPLNNFNQQYYQSNRHFPPPPSLLSTERRNFMARNKQREGRSLDDDINQQQMQMGSTDNEFHVEDIDNENWKYHRAHRDRRDLYQRIEGTSPISSWDVKSCLLRAICETQHFLMPRGYSLLQDMLRVIFTVPIRDDMRDEYSDAAMRSSGEECYNFYSEKCPLSILAFLLKLKN